MPSEPRLHDERVPTASAMMSWIETIVARGIRRPGYDADAWTEQWVRDQLVAMGLEDVRLDPIDVRRWEPLDWSLSVWREGDPAESISLPAYPVPFTADTGPAGVEAPISLAAEGEDVAGRIAVVENQFLALPQTVMTSLFSRWEHDPRGEFETLVQTLPFGGDFQNVLEPWIDGGAAGFVGILRGLPWETDRYYVPYDAVSRPIPAVWVSATNGDRLLAFLEGGPARARLAVTRSLEEARSHNVVGTLPGRSDEWVIIGSHHDGPWASAVEDAAGVALVLAQASYWSRVPKEERPHNLLFLLNGGHMSGGAGLRHFVETNDRLLREKVVVEIHLEHPAREARGENGALLPTDEPEVRWWFTSWAPPLEEAVVGAICAEDLVRSMLMPVEGFPPGSEHPPTDAAFFHPLTPIVSFLTAPMYLFDEQDTIDKVHVPSLEPLTRATIRIVNAMSGQSAAGLRSTIYAPPRSEPLARCDGRGDGATP